MKTLALITLLTLTTLAFAIPGSWATLNTPPTPNVYSANR